MKRIFIYCLLLYALPLSAQPYQLQLQPVDQPLSFIEKNIKYQKKVKDSISLLANLEKIITQLQSGAYLGASVDSVAFADSLATAYLFIGPQYEWGHLYNGNMEESFLSQAGYRERLYRNKPFDYQEVVELQEALLDHAENHGYPFAEIRIDSIQLSGNSFTAGLFIEKQQLTLIESIEIEGDARISNSYLSNYLGLKPGEPYDQSKILRIRNRIQELPFLKLDKDPIITFERDKATVNLFIGKKKASRFDFLIGVLPNPGGSEDKSFLITGTFKGEFQNQFGLGERIYLEFEQLRPETQQLDIEFNYPYVLDLPFGVDFQFDLYKRDTSYLDVVYDIGIQYLLEGGNYLKAFWNNRSSRVLTIDENRLINTGQLPNNLDVTYSSFGLEYNYQKLDYRYNPRKGWGGFLRAGAGVKKIKKNNRIQELDFGTLYDSLELRTFQYRIDAKLEAFWPLGGNATVKAGAVGGLILSESPVYLNEQYRIGGNKLLRGFDEEFIFATNYVVFTLEPRLLIGQNSFLYAFGDYAYVENITTEKDDRFRPFGFGAGISFETKVGVFGLSLAFGKLRDEAIDFSAPKVHFGYLSLF